MRRIARLALGRLALGRAVLAGLLAAPGLLPAAPAMAQQPPHAWLFGSWTGGLFPVPSGLATQSCLSTPVVIFTRDVVLRASLTETLYTQRVIVTARTNPGVTDFQFTPAVDPGAATSSGLLGVAAPRPAIGFGCADPNALHVQRKTENEITFPGCPEFAYPLVRCR